MRVIGVMDDSEDGNKYICLEAKKTFNSGQYNILRRWVNYNDATEFMLHGPSMLAEQSASVEINADNLAREIDQQDNSNSTIDPSEVEDDDLSPFYGGTVSFM